MTDTLRPGLCSARQRALQRLLLTATLLLGAPAWAQAQPAPAPQPLFPLRVAPPAAEEPAPPPRTLSVSVDANHVLLLEDGADVRWRLVFPEPSGVTQAALLHDGDVWVAHAHHLLQVDADSGMVKARFVAAAPIAALAVDGGGVTLTLRFGTTRDSHEIAARLAVGGIEPALPFDAPSVNFDSLQLEAAVDDPLARLERDPTNPFLHLALADTAPTSIERDLAVARALDATSTFYDAARLAIAFAEREWWEPVSSAMAFALADFLRRGYDPALLTSVAMHTRYAFPLAPMQAALASGDDTAQAVWAPWLFAFSGPDLPEAGAALRDYAEALTIRAEREPAATWRENAAERSNLAVADIFARNAVRIGRGGDATASALLLAFLALHLTLTVKYTHARALSRRRMEARPPSWRALASGAMRYYGLTERLVLLGLLATIYAALTLFAWVRQTDPAVQAMAAGHPNAVAVARAWNEGGSSGDTTASAWLNAYRLDRAGDSAAARAALAGITDPTFDRVLAAAGRGASIPAPSPVVLRAAAGGSYLQALADSITQPWRLLTSATPLLGSPAWVWWAVLSLWWLLAAWHLLWLLVPRPRMAAQAPRPLAYELLALLVPGSGGADELYGLLLLIPWAVFGLDTLYHLFGGNNPLDIPLAAGLTVLVVVYLINAVAWAIEFASVRQRLAQLKLSEPHLAREFGLLPAADSERTPSA